MAGKKGRKKSRKSGRKTGWYSRGKKAWSRRYRRSQPLTLGQKAAVAIGVLPPIGWSAADALSPILNPNQFMINGVNPDFITQLRLAGGSFIDSLAQGFSLPRIFAGGFLGNDQMGRKVTYTPQVSAPTGAWWITTTLSFTLLITEWMKNLFLRVGTGRRSGMRFMGQKVA